MTTSDDQEAPHAVIETLVAAARRRIEPRVRADRLMEELRDGALVVDIRPVAQRERDGELPGAVVIDRNVLEWRLDPSSSHRIPEADRTDVRVVVVCDEGYASSLAAATLKDVGLTRVTDLVGGFQAWRRECSSTPVTPDAAIVRVGELGVHAQRPS